MTLIKFRRKSLANPLMQYAEKVTRNPGQTQRRKILDPFPREWDMKLRVDLHELGHSEWMVKILSIGHNANLALRAHRPLLRNQGNHDAHALPVGSSLNRSTVLIKKLITLSSRKPLVLFNTRHMPLSELAALDDLSSPLHVSAPVTAVCPNLYLIFYSSSFSFLS